MRIPIVRRVLVLALVAVAAASMAVLMAQAPSNTTKPAAANLSDKVA